jgi:glycerol-3-phosphate dehydrogenase
MDKFDLVVVGGGIHGAAVTRDAAGRRLKVMLAEKCDYAFAMPLRGEGYGTLHR